MHALHTDTPHVQHTDAGGLLTSDHCVLCGSVRPINSTQQVLMLLLPSYVLLNELLQLLRLRSNHLIDLLAVLENLSTHDMAQSGCRRGVLRVEKSKSCAAAEPRRGEGHAKG